jgi:hypothetical protein
VGGARTKDEFIRLRTERDKTLGLPALIIPAVQINIRAGELPPVEANDMRYLKIPIDGAQAFSVTIDKEPPTP